MATLSQEMDREVIAYKALERKVLKLRPESLDPDLLEERVRLVLGYTYPDEITVVSN